jgi:hypothetical protein
LTHLSTFTFCTTFKHYS